MVYFAKFSKSAPEVRIWLQTSSVREPMNWGVAFRSWSSAIASTMLPMLYQRDDLRRCDERCQNRVWDFGSDERS